MSDTKIIFTRRAITELTQLQLERLDKLIRDHRYAAEIRLTYRIGIGLLGIITYPIHLESHGAGDRAVQTAPTCFLIDAHGKLVSYH